MVFEMTEIFFDIATTLLTILAMLLAFQMFFCTLRFSKEWSPKTVFLFKIMILTILIVIFTTGITCIYCLNNIIINNILFYTLIFIIIFMIIATLIVTIFTIKE